MAYWGNNGGQSELLGVRGLSSLWQAADRVRILEEQIKQAYLARQQALYTQGIHPNIQYRVGPTCEFKPKEPQNLSFKEELQREVDEWLEGVLE